MTICGYKKKFDEKTRTGNEVQDRSLCYTTCDLLCNLKCKYQWWMALISFFFSLYVLFFFDLSVCDYNRLTGVYLSVFSSTLGISIAAYAIVIGFQSDSLKKLLVKDGNNVKPFHVICASMVFNGILQALTVMFSCVFQLTCGTLIFYISTFLSMYSIMQILDILLQLFSLRTFVVNCSESSNN